MSVYSHGEEETLHRAVIDDREEWIIIKEAVGEGRQQTLNERFDFGSANDNFVVANQATLHLMLHNTQNPVKFDKTKFTSSGHF